MRFADFDMRGYRTVDVRTGYGQWVASYEDTVEDVMDIALLDDLTVPRWGGLGRVVDLGCGTGRTGAWLRGRGVTGIDGVDLTPEMLDVARNRGAHDRLVEADVTRTGLESGAYDLAISSLIDEHLADLRPFYDEAWRLTAPGGLCVVVAYHPHFIMTAGMPTHFTSADGEHIAITTHVHLTSDHVTSALGAGWALAEMREGLIDDAWLAVKPKWERFRNHPISAAFTWRKPA
ncbi:MAG TPA: class I SAM-dependent methyltransferase [Streptosporangiaceae bacterium]|jgi:SAM-dependent methyltransferase